MSKYTAAEEKQIKAELVVARKEAEFKRFNKMLFWKPYEKQRRFYEQGKEKRERLFMAGNRVGKSEAGAFEVACHATGLYPDWWPGRKFDHPTKGWVAGETGVATRDICQSKLFGNYAVVRDYGTGMIPKKLIAGVSRSRAASDSYDTASVKHFTDGVEDGESTIAFKSYEQGREKFQGEQLDYGWADEEAPEKIYTEFLTRMGGGGCLFTTYTGLHGQTELSLRFLREPSPDRAVVFMDLDEALHYTPAEKQAMLAGYPAYQRKTRKTGMPLLGTGMVFPYDPESFKEPAIDYIPDYWVKLWGIDFGIAHPFAAALILWDRDNDVIHVHSCYRQADVQPIHHAVAIKSRGASVPIAWPQDGTARESSGKPLASLYRELGLLMLPSHATFPDGSISTEAGILEMDQRMTTGRLKVASHLSEWFDEFGAYHRDEKGQIVKVRDDLMSATRVAIMAKRFARAVPIGNFKMNRTRTGQASDVDFDPFCPGD